MNPIDKSTTPPVHWEEYQATLKRKFLKTPTPQMLLTEGYLTTEGTKPHGVRSREYGKGTGLPGIDVLWDKAYITAYLDYHFRFIKEMPEFYELLFAWIECFSESADPINSNFKHQLKELLDVEKATITNPESPRFNFINHELSAYTMSQTCHKVFVMIDGQKYVCKYYSSEGANRAWNKLKNEVKAQSKWDGKIWVCTKTYEEFCSSWRLTCCLIKKIVPKVG